MSSLDIPKLQRDRSMYEEDENYVWDFETNLQYVKPYWELNKSYTKRRWENKPIKEIFLSEKSYTFRNVFSKAVEKKRIGVNGKLVTPEYKMQKNDYVEIWRHRHEPPTWIPVFERLQRKELTVCFENDKILALDKPASLSIHPAQLYSRNTLLHMANHGYFQKNNGEAQEKEEEKNCEKKINKCNTTRNDKNNENDSDFQTNQKPEKHTTNEKKRKRKRKRKRKKKALSETNNNAMTMNQLRTVLPPIASNPPYAFRTVHRLDRLTSGVTILAKSPAAAREWID